MDHPKEIGDRTTLAVMLALLTLEYKVSIPFGENTRYDLIVENEGSIHRVQCKTGWLRKGAIEFPTASSYYHHPNEKKSQRHYKGQVDIFAVYCRQTSRVYLIPIDQLPADKASLRVTPPLNGQRKHIRYASDYEIARIECRPRRKGRRPGDTAVEVVNS